KDGLSNIMGAMEPLLPMEPLLLVFQSQKICDHAPRHLMLMSIEYSVHDFYSMCRNLKRHRMNIFVDMGASLDKYHWLKFTNLCQMNSWTYTSSIENRLALQLRNMTGFWKLSTCLNSKIIDCKKNYNALVEELFQWKH
ncbi:hypothetical protein HJC23_007531, partial [Cyclotella cryptica]